MPPKSDWPPRPHPRPPNRPFIGRKSWVTLSAPRGEAARNARRDQGNMQANPRKTTSFRPLGDVDIADLRERVLAIPEAVWDAENATKPNKFDALSSTRHIVFRFVSSPLHWAQSYDRPVWAAWREPVMRVIGQAIAPYGYARPMFPRIMLARM